MCVISSPNYQILKSNPLRLLEKIAGQLSVESAVIFKSILFFFLI